jgi:hypothetical protein
MIPQRVGMPVSGKVLKNISKKKFEQLSSQESENRFYISPGFRR